MTCFRSGQNRSRLRPEILAAFCFNRSGEIQEKALYIADIQGFLLSIGVSFWPLWSGKRDSDPRPQPWQGCALPTELFPHCSIASAKVDIILKSAIACGDFFICFFRFSVLFLFMAFLYRHFGGEVRILSGITMDKYSFY